MVFTDIVNPPTAGITNPPEDSDTAIIDHREATSINLVDMEALSFEHYSLTKNRSSPPDSLPVAEKKPRKWHVFLLPNLPGPTDKFELDSSFSCSPVDWCDYFSLPFHIQSETDTTFWKSMLDNLS